MTWFKVDDGFLTHPKVFGIKSGPLALWLRAGLWCAKELTDGVMSARAVKALEAKPAHIQELLDRGLWEPFEDGFRFHNFLRYQPSRDQVLKTRNETLQRVRKHRNAVTNADVTPAPGPGPGPQFSPEEEEKKLGALSLSETAPANDRARDRSARFEKPPLPPAPLELPPPERKPDPWLRVWELYADHIGLDVFQLPHASTQERALRAIAASAEVEAGGSQGVGFENAVKRLLGAWNRDKWVQEKQPSIANLAANLHRYAAPKQKPIVKLAPQPADSLMAHWDRLDAMRREEERREDELNAIRCRELLAAEDALDRAGGAS